MADLKTVADILDALKNLSLTDMAVKPEDMPHINDAITSLENVSSADKANDEQVIQAKKDLVSTPSGVADTGVLTGPIGGLKNFLLKTQRDNESQ